MSQTDVEISDYADKLMSTPRAHVRMELTQDESGLLLVHSGQTVVHCPLTEHGMMAAGFLAQTLGVKIPALGDSVPVRVSTGVLFRAVGVAGLDYGKEESYVLLDRLLDEAEMQRGASSDAT
jgi:hypothetical protein